MTHPSKLSDELHAEVMRAVTSNEAGWFDRLFAILMVDRLDCDEPFTLEVVADVFEKTARRGGASPSPRDAGDVRDLYEALAPHLDDLKEREGADRFAEVFRLAYRP